MKRTTISSAALLAATLGYLPFTTAQQANQTEHPIYLLSEDETFHFELLVPLSQAVYSGADVGPVLEAAKNVTPGDFDSFGEVFYAIANKTKAEAEDPKNAYDPVNVRDTWFSAATYFRRADFFLHGDWENPLINTLWEEQTAAFDNALEALPVPGKRFQVPADNFTVEVIWYGVDVDHECTQRPTLILGNGYDGSQEDLYHTIVIPALARGWNCLTYEGPGQPLVRRRQDLGFIPDWERAVTPLVDYLLSEKAGAVDPDRLVLFGLSFGGYLAARAAAFEPRLSAVMLNGGVWDIYERFTEYLAPEMIELLESGKKEEFDKQAAKIPTSPKVPAQARWGFEQGLWSFNMKSPFDWFQELKNYRVKDFVDRIDIPVWIADAEFEGFFMGQSAKVKEAIGDNATLHVFQGPAGYHCQVGAFQEMTRTMFSWLHETLG